MIIGSTAIKHYFPDFPREPKDIDIVAFDEYDKQDLIRIHKDIKHIKVEVLINPILLQYYKNIKGNIPAICDLHELYTLKISHIFWKLENNSWNKHMWDIQWLKDKGCKLIPELFKTLYDYWNTVHGKNKRSNLEMSGEDFFDNAVKFPIEHDYLHELLIKHEYFKGQEKPTYSLILKDSAEVDVDEQKWKLLTHEQKYNLVFEEVSVMSIEREFHKDFRISYHRMLDKFIRNHAPLWEAIWIIENYKECLKPVFNYKEFLNKQINKQINK